MDECEHGTPGGALGGCPPCLGGIEPISDFQVFAVTNAEYEGVCLLDCGDPIEVDDYIAKIGDTEETAEWAAHLKCTEK